MRLMVLICFCCSLSFAAGSDFESHLRSASDVNAGMTARWHSLLSAAEMATPAQIAAIKKFTNSEEWYMRNAALLALKRIDINVAKSEAKKLVQDKALVVRSAAVDLLADNPADDIKQLLIQELNKPYNFNKKSSLWIRKQIVEKLSLSAGPQDKTFFAKNLFDSDRNVAELSAKALEKITGQTQPSVEKWKNIARESNWL